MDSDGEKAGREIEGRAGKVGEENEVEQGKKMGDERMEDSPFPPSLRIEPTSLPATVAIEGGTGRWPAAAASEVAYRGGGDGCDGCELERVRTGRREDLPVYH